MLFQSSNEPDHLRAVLVNNSYGGDDADQLLGMILLRRLQSARRPCTIATRRVRNNSDPSAGALSSRKARAARWFYRIPY